jgi:uridylate kinase
MDATAFALCRDNEMPIIVFNMTTPGNFSLVLAGEAVSTRVVRDVEKTEYA